MALDAQSNWNVEMAQTTCPQFSSEEMETQSIAPVVMKAPGREIHLPVEVILNIISFIRRRESSQRTLWAASLVSKIWYEASISRLYEHPYLSGKNFQEFVRTVCPSKNAHIRKSELADMVKWLDMSLLTYDSSRSLTARLLARLKTGLRRFIAPQASFGINCFASLSKCKELEYLNLSLISASISLKLLYQTLRNLELLRTLYLPRSSNSDERRDYDVFWPPRLEALHLAGGINDDFLQENLHTFPDTLNTMSIQHCSHVSPTALELFLQCVGPQLLKLTIAHPMGSLNADSLDGVLSWCPNLTALRVNIELVTPELLEKISGKHPLRILDLDCAGHNVAQLMSFTPDMISKKLPQVLTCLRSVRIHPALGWSETFEQPMEDLSDQLEEMEAKEPLLGDNEAGVWEYGDF